MDLDRRRFLGTTGAAAAAVGLAAALPGTAAAQVPLLGDSGSTGLQPIEGPGLVGLRAPGGSTEALGEARFALPTGWSEWVRLPAPDGGTDDGAGAASGPVATPDGAHGFEVRAPRGSSPVYAGAAAAGAPGPDGLEVEGTAQVPGVARYALLPTVDVYGIPVVHRAAWGADEGITWSRPEFREAQLITVHHSVTPAGWDPAATMRAFHRYHTLTNGWGDIGYQLVIDPSGQVYQGRTTDSAYPVFRGPTPPGVRPAVVTGAHVGGNNSGNVGVCLMGNFDLGMPTPGAYAALVNVLARLCRALNLDPFQGVGYWNPDAGAGRGMQAINGHRDWMSTGCPGGSLYASLPAVRQAVAVAMNTGTWFPTSAGLPIPGPPGSVGSLGSTG